MSEGSRGPRGVRIVGGSGAGRVSSSLFGKTFPSSMITGKRKATEEPAKQAVVRGAAAAVVVRAARRARLAWAVGRRIYTARRSSVKDLASRTWWDLGRGVWCVGAFFDF